MSSVPPPGAVIETPTYWMFHGTSAENAWHIVRDGFKLSAHQANAKLLGMGVYCTGNSSKAHSYAVRNWIGNNNVGAIISLLVDPTGKTVVIKKDTPLAMTWQQSYAYAWCPFGANNHNLEEFVVADPARITITGVTFVNARTAACEGFHQQMTHPYIVRGTKFAQGVLASPANAKAAALALVKAALGGGGGGGGGGSAKRSEEHTSELQSRE